MHRSVASDALIVGNLEDMKMPQLKLKVIPGKYGVFRFPADASIPQEVISCNMVSITRSERELTIVCEEGMLPAADKSDLGWVAIQIDCSFTLDATGVIASVSEPLAEAKISLYLISTFDTDYILVKESVLEGALEQLSKAGHRVEANPPTNRWS